MKTKHISYIRRRIRVARLRTAMFVATIAAFFLPVFHTFESTGDNMFVMSVNGTEVGTVESESEADALLREARRKIAGDSEELVLMEIESSLSGQEVIWGQVDSRDAVLENIVKVLSGTQKQTLKRSYMVKMNGYTVNLANTDEVQALLQASLDKYDPGKRYTASLVADSTRELNVLTAQVSSTAEIRENEKKSEEVEVFKRAGIGASMEEVLAEVQPVTQKEFEDYDLGLIGMDFEDQVEVVEAYMPEKMLTNLQAAIEDVTKEQEVNTVYEIVAGDTLSEISLNTGIPLDKIIELNDTLENENSIIRVGDELIITVPEPELSVERVEQNYYEEYYDEEIIYVDNDDWYTTQTKTLQQPSAGYRKVVATVTFRNNSEVSREIMLEDVVVQAVPKIVERGTKIPPTYIKPLSGGRISSPFGRRSAPKRGASTYHKGLDYATPVGTSIVASAAGTVTRAGWGSGYGYVVYIRHADGRETRYAHLSKVLVSVGQSVSQGQRIALSGNTGVSTGPHLHFEILIGGTQVDPQKYLTYY